MKWYIFSHMIWNFRGPYIIITSIEKCISLHRASILIDIRLDSNIFLRGECSSIPLPATSIRSEISVKQMIVHPLARGPPVSATHIACDSCDIHTQMIVHVARLIERLYSEIDRFYTSIFIEKCSRHIMSKDVCLIEADIDHHPISPESFPYSKEVLSPSKLF